MLECHLYFAILSVQQTVTYTAHAGIWWCTSTSSL